MQETFLLRNKFVLYINITHFCSLLWQFCDKKIVSKIFAQFVIFIFVKIFFVSFYLCQYYMWIRVDQRELLDWKFISLVVGVLVDSFVVNNTPIYRFQTMIIVFFPFPKIYSDMTNTQHHKEYFLQNNVGSF